ncbi:MAG TPA: cupredoxin domain-containing protein [Symbiobacteriaceae bacterium]|jgi:uncharacterized cupredoxin-like copper-binding protein
MERNNRRMLLAGAALVLAGTLTLAGCGSQTRTVTVAMGPGMIFAPANLGARAGDTLVVQLSNVDNEDHDIHVPALGAHLHLRPGEKGQVRLSPKKAGSYEIVCTLPGHKEAGMVGTLLVR